MRARPRPTPTAERLADAYPDLLPNRAPIPKPEPTEGLSEITGAIHGLADYIAAMDARTAEVEKALRARKPAPDSARHATVATGYRVLGVVAVATLICVATVVGLYLLVDAGVLR